MKLSVTIITLNEERDLPRAVASVSKLADEIIVVDSGSTDKTVAIAKRLGCRVYRRDFDNYANQKNYALKLAKGDWILSLDADEEIPPEGSREIIGAIEKQGIAAYSLPRKNIILGKFIKYTRWQPELDRHVWLWRKNSGRWSGEVHEEVVVDGKVGKLTHPKIHHQDRSVAEFLDMTNRYSEIEAKEKIKKGVKFSLFRVFFDPTYNFLVRYVYRLGFLDGWRGFVLSYLMAIYHLEVWIKIWEGKQR